MRLTAKTDYCLRVLIYLQKNKGRAKISEIAEAFLISKNHLSVAVNKLSELGYVISTSGPKGGIEFNPEAAEKSVGELVVAIEDLDIVECFNAKTNTCVLSPECRLRHMLKQASGSFVSELNGYKIRDLI
ncbi:MAG: Rrf2 family transcriptional regulator [Bdellovibrionota bacterium]